MKVWLKLLIGSLLGILLGFFLPYENQTILSGLAWFEGLALRIGRYTAVPIVIFSLTIAIYELRQDGHFWKLVLQSFLIIAGSALLVIAMGIIVILIFPPARIPIPIEEQLSMVSLGVSENLLELFPANMFSALVSESVYLLPVYIFAFFLGMGFSYDRNYTKPVISFTDSLSRIFYYIASFFSEILGFVMILLAACWAVRYHGVIQARVFRDLIMLLGIFSAVLGFGIMPLLLYVLRPKTNPWIALYGSLGPAIAAFFSGDINFTLPVLVRHVKENLGARRRSNTVTISLFTVFCRAGSAMVAAVTFIVIIKSYISLKINPADILSIGGRAFFISFFLARHPGDGAFAALGVLCLGFGRGYEAGYLILKSLAFYLIAIGTFLDVMLASFGSFALAKINGFQEEKSPRHFI
ncbi:MAG: cation:dicarboxylase symporter family transporter [Treponema sp.]|jgi:Na+/H+-dicarboxylate symporter|nr:cation:dicarboxylase symporter family transporter [Treponema sp.]